MRAGVRGERERERESERERKATKSKAGLVGGSTDKAWAITIIMVCYSARVIVNLTVPESRGATGGV